MLVHNALFKVKGLHFFVIDTEPAGAWLVHEAVIMPVRCLSLMHNDSTQMIEQGILLVFSLRTLNASVSIGHVRICRPRTERGRGRGGSR